MNLYLIHCGFYDDEISDGIYEFHVNIPVVAETTDGAKAKVRTNPAFQKKKMHIDGIQEIKTVDAFRIQLERSSEASSVINNIPYRDC
ncbi:MAG: DUF1543 domain-containing protein [Proteobacteria bacterium]|nr:DUF1543 domain-containing protein [Pseudomonadota bacterium]